MNFSPVLSRDFLRLGRFSVLLAPADRSGVWKQNYPRKISTQKVRIIKFNFYFYEVWVKAYFGVILSLAIATNKISSLGISDFFFFGPDWLRFSFKLLHTLPFDHSNKSSPMLFGFHLEEAFSPWYFNLCSISILISAKSAKSTWRPYLQSQHEAFSCQRPRRWWRHIVSKRKNMADPLYCICRQTYDPSQFMIQCDSCEEWYHGRLAWLLLKLSVLKNW